MKVRLLPGFPTSLAAILFAGTLSVLAQLPAPAPPITPAGPAAPAIPPPLDARGETIPPNITVSGTPAPSATPVDDKKTTDSPHPIETRRHTGAKFMGAITCSSSLCHGGGGIDRGSYTIWQRSDPHRSAAATLAGTRAARIAQGINVASATGSNRCTVCHIPLAVVSEERLASGIDVMKEGVSCESCHGPAENWMRSHTRKDFTHAQNVQTGVRELRSLYARASSCVGCHQVLEPDLLTAGHPPLLFELDAQTVAEPRHWNDPGDYFGPKAWLTGQAVALRETSWALGQNSVQPANQKDDWRALVWLLEHAVSARGDRGDLPSFDEVPNADTLTAGNVARAQTTADEFARAASRLEWSGGHVRRCLAGLADLDKEFTTGAGSESEASLRGRAQRLALALSRLLAPLQKQDADKWMAASKELDRVFSATDARAGFDRSAFASQLKTFREALSKAGLD